MRYGAAVLTGVGIIDDKEESHEGMKSEAQNLEGPGGARTKNTGSGSHHFKEKNRGCLRQHVYERSI